MYEFKEGDRVVTARNCHLNVEHSPTREGVVRMTDSPTWLLIEFDETVYGHDGDGNYRDGHCWWCDKQNIEPAVITLENE